MRASPGHPANQPARSSAKLASGSGVVLEQVHRLREEGGTYRAIAAAAGLATTTVHDLASGRRQPTPNTARALLKVTSDILPRARIHAGGSRLRLRALHVMGHGSARIARALGVREMTIRRIVTGDATTLSPDLRDAIADLYDAWWDKRAPERTRAERGAATAARRRAIAGNWCAGAGLDDDELDVPGYRPKSGWKHATGTGTAPEIRPASTTAKEQRRMNSDDRITHGFIAQVQETPENHHWLHDRHPEPGDRL
jgi:transcriptional regulator with XRE-family HTH domain